MTKEKNKLPIGIKLVIILLAIMSLFSLGFLFLPNFALGIILTLISMSVMIFLAIGLGLRMKFARLGTIILLSFGIFLSVVNITFGFSKFDEPFFTRNIISAVVIIYLMRRNIKKIFQ